MTEAYVCDYIRTPIGRYAGVLRDMRPDDLAAHVVMALKERNPAIDWDSVDEVVFGCANQAGEDNRNVARMAALLAGLSPSIPASTVNRLCASGMDAVAQAARAIKSGEADLVIAGGVESMTRAPLVMAKATEAFSRQIETFDTTIGWRFVNPRMKAAYGVDSMPETAENVAADYGISREDQDLFALRSQQRAEQARTAGFFREEISPVKIDNKKSSTLVTEDEHPRSQTTLESLAKLKAPFRANGTVTAGNASGVNDGAAALIIASEAAARRFGLEPKARIMRFAAAGVEPRVMGIGPVPAIRRLLERQDLHIGDIDLIELNEAFAAQALAVTRQLDLPDDAPQVNPHGGAIALGHPLGMSGARLVGTLARSLAKHQSARGIATMCVGVGQGTAMLVERA